MNHTISFKQIILALSLGSLLFISGCFKNPVDSGSTLPSSEQGSTERCYWPWYTYCYSYEYGFEWWNRDRDDIELGDDTIQWSITRSNDRAAHGCYSLKYYLNNLNDAGKIWVEKPFYGMPYTRYLVRVSFSFASADYTQINNFTIIAGASSKNPETIDDFPYRKKTYNGGYNGYRWLDNSFTTYVTTDWRGVFYVGIGVWGTWETPRTYYVDKVIVEY